MHNNIAEEMMCQEVGRGRLNDRSAYAPDCLGDTVLR